MSTKSGEGEHTGLSVGYYSVQITSPTTPGRPEYIAECNDIIEALELSYAEGNILKALWRRAASRMGKKKKGNDSKYDAEKMVFFATRELEKEHK